ncbi:MAG: M15 family metallopeptidase [Byssovorax sp.]
MKLRSIARLLPALALLGAPACVLDASEPAPPEPSIAPPAAPEPIGEATSALTVQEAINSSCSTTSVKGLSLQIVDQANCIAPGAYALVPAEPNLSLGAAVFPYLQAPARDALVSALAAHPGSTMTVNSMLRTVAQQYLLYTWYQNGQCGIGLAATPGSSNHESGLALDVSEYGTWKPWLTAKGFTWFGNADTVHFDYTGPGVMPFKGNDVRAFQQLWNKNNPGDTIAEDGAYGPQTGTRLAKSPAGGFAMGPSCAVASGPDVWPAISLDAKDTLPDQDSMGVADLFEGETHTASITLTNKGGAAAPTVDVSAWIEEPYLSASDYLIESDWTHPGTFTVNEANDEPLNPPHDAPPGAAFTLKIHALSPGETKRITLTVHAAQYSIGIADSPDVRFWVADIPGVYHQADFNVAPTLSKGQTFGGGTLQTYVETDVYSHTKWELDSARYEGWAPTGDAMLASDAKAGALTVGSQGADPGVATATALFAATDYAAIGVRARRTGGTGSARLFFATDAEPAFSEDKSLDFDLPDDDAFHDVTIVTGAHPKWTGTITGLRLDPFVNDPGSIELDHVRAITPDGGETGGSGGAGSGATTTGVGGQGGSGNADAPPGASCSCAIPGGDEPGSSIWGLASALGVGLVFWRRRSRLAPC